MSRGVNEEVVHIENDIEVVHTKPFGSEKPKVEKTREEKIMEYMKKHKGELLTGTVIALEALNVQPSGSVVNVLKMMNKKGLIKKLEIRSCREVLYYVGKPKL